MAEPTSMEDYERRYMANYRVSGFGIEGVTTHFPCPFCCEPDWAVIRIIDFQEECQRNRSCSVCGRSARTILTVAPGSKSLELVQTGGPPPAEWMNPAPRRVEEEE